MVAAVALMFLGVLVACGANPQASRWPAAGPATVRDSEAHLAYLSGRAAFEQGYSDTANQTRARADLERAVARNPGFAPAWALLARIYGTRYRTTMDRHPATLDAAERAARTAVALDPRLPAGHLALADVFFSRRNRPRARAALDAGREVLAGEAAYWHLLAFIAQREGLWRDAEAAYAQAFDLDAPATAEWLAVHFLHLRQYTRTSVASLPWPRRRAARRPSCPMRGPVSVSARTSRRLARCSRPPSAGGRRPMPECSAC